ncbi:MAG: CPBP family glutamic-type intramembrane protease [Phycisphaerae bacterium]
MPRRRRRRIRTDAIRRPPPRSAPRPPTPRGYYGGTQRPLQCLAFLLPITVAYELGMAWLHRSHAVDDGPDLAAQLVLQWFFSLFGATGYYLPGLALVAVLLAWHVASREQWRIEVPLLAGMSAESVLLALPLLVFSRVFNTESLAAATSSGGVLEELLLSLGAGIYEELVFRLMLISLLMLLLRDILRLKQSWSVGAAVCLSSLAFAAHHYPPIGSDEFTATAFAFRALAGGYLAGVYVIRGFGIAVGCHAVYDVIAVALI